MQKKQKKNSQIVAKHVSILNRTKVFFIMLLNFYDMYLFSIDFTYIHFTELYSLQDLLKTLINRLKKLVYAKPKNMNFLDFIIFYMLY